VIFENLTSVQHFNPSQTHPIRRTGLFFILNPFAAHDLRKLFALWSFKSFIVTLFFFFFKLMIY